MTRKGLIILAIWYVTFLVAAAIFRLIHPTAIPNAPDSITSTFLLVGFIYLFAGGVLIPWLFRKPDEQSLSAGQPY